MQVASLMVLSGISEELHVDLIVSLIASGFIESSYLEDLIWWCDNLGQSQVIKT